ncbi:MAG: NosD domain-containing protein, partial [Candidatus Thorarchaeota archaeon]
MRKSVLLVALIVILSLSISSDDNFKNQAVDTKQSPQIEFSQSYSTHSPIVIKSNADFISQGWSGTGSPSSPFRIENLSIYQGVKNAFCIQINDTDAHFKIQNCLLVGVEAKSGIHLQNVTNGTIDNNTINTQSYELYGVWTQSIALVDSDYNTISNNTCRFIGHGIDLLRSDHNTIFNNTCDGGSDGIWIASSNYNTVVNNTSGNHTQGALYISGGSNNILENNSLRDSQRGVILGSTSSNTVVDNTMTNCGMWFPSTVYVQTEVSGNTVNGLPLGYYHSQTDFVIDQAIGQILLVDCMNFRIENIEISNSTIGIFILECENGVIQNVTSRDHSMYAIEIKLSKNVNVTDCRMTDSKYGLSLYTHNFILDSALFITNCTFERLSNGISSIISNCTITWNSFSEINNYDVYDYYEGNLFQYNYYEEYLGTDGDEDGFGDTPYTIYGDPKANDTYPLMYKPYNPEWGVIPTDTSSVEDYDFIRNYSVSSESPIISTEVSDSANFSFDESGILENATILNPGIYNIELSIKNLYNRTLKTDITITVTPETIPPSLNYIVDLQIEFGDEGHVLVWAPSDVHPYNYSTFLDTVLIYSGPWNSSSETISIVLDGLPEGLYNFSILVMDSRGNTAGDAVFVDVYVNPPTLSGNDEISFVHGTSGNIATWTSSGTFPLNYSLFRNGHLIGEGIWNSSSEIFEIYLDSLDVGIYTYRLEVNNSAGTDYLTTVVYVFADNYQSHAPISIQSDSDFITQSWPGSGTAEDPYIIAGLNITDSGVCIFVDQTSSHFIIFDCYISSPVQYSGYGIQLWRLDNGAIINCRLVSKSRSIEVWWSNSISIIDCVIEESHDGGISISDADGFEILNCSIENVANNGMSIFRSIDGVIDNCLFYGDGMYPMTIDVCTDLVISNNTFGQKGFRLTGDSLIHYTSNHFEGNIVDGKDVGFFVHESDITINGNIYGQYILVNCSDVILSGGNFDYGYVSVSLAFCNNCTVDGISAYRSSGTPVLLNWCTGCIVKNCDIDWPVNRGILLKNCFQCYIYDNTIDFASAAIELWRCGGCTIFSNSANSGYCGVYVSFSNLTQIYGNDLDYNQIGVY